MSNLNLANKLKFFIFSGIEIAMNKIIPFTNHPEIGENIFNYLDLQDLLNCQLVCQDWKHVLEDPYFWTDTSTIAL